MKLTDLNIIQNITPRWGAGHFLAKHQNGDLLEVLVAEQSSESVTSLLSWAHSLERVSHPSIPEIQTIIHNETTFVALRLQEGVSLSHPLQNERESITRLDIISTFYQLATALKKLHDHELNHCNLTLDHMKLIGDGWLQLRGWTPPPIETTFTLRKVDELKRLKNFFYLAIVGQFPPTHRNHNTQMEQKLTPFQTQCLEAWGRWYHDESKRPQPNLSATRLMLFDDPPVDCQEVIEELTPFLDQSLVSFYGRLSESLEEREVFDHLYLKRQSLLEELEQTYKATQLWLNQHQEDKLLVDQQVAKIEQMFTEAHLFQQQLERLSGMRLSHAQNFLNDHAHYFHKAAHTQLYQPVSGSSVSESSSSSTLGMALQQLDVRWQSVNPEQPIYIDSNDLSTGAPSQAGSISRASENSDVSSPLRVLSWAELPPVMVRPDQREITSPAKPLASPSLHTEVQSQYSELGMEPLPSHIDIPVADPQDGEPGATRIYMPMSDSGVGEGPRDSLFNPSIFNPLVPGKTKTAFTEHLREYDGAEFFNPHQTNEPKVAFSHKNFFAFLYLTAALVFIWSLKSHDAQTQQPKASPNLATASVTINGEESNKEGADVNSTPTVEPSSHLRPAHSDLNANPLEDSETKADRDEQREVPPPEAPQDMVYIPGGILIDGLDDAAYNRVVTHCIFEPDYAGRDRRSRERCKRLIKRPKRSPSTVRVGPFFLDIFEVSRRDYQQYCRAGGVCNQRVHFEDKELSLPVVQISMIQAMDYCRFYQKSLPSHEQWLFAARGESASLYPWGNQPVLESGSYRANYKSKLSTPRRGRRRREIDGFRGVHPVRHNSKLGLSAFGVAHLAGNVREWVSRDRRRRGWVTGGSWRQPLWSLRLTDGEYLDQFVESSDDIGFRCAKNITVP